MSTEHGAGLPAYLSEQHLRTYEAILRRPTAHNLEWNDIRSLLAAVADVSQGHNDSLQMSRNGQNITLHAPRYKDVASAEEIVSIAHFLNKLSAASSGSVAFASIDLIVVINLDGAMIYRTVLHGEVPRRIEPYDPHGLGSELHSKKERSECRCPLEQSRFSDAIASTLREADAIMIFVADTGESSAMERLLAELNFHQDVLGHIIGLFVVEDHDQTESQLLAKVRLAFETLLSNSRTTAEQSNTE